uniref:C-type lectin domain-containing protein n=1 Tax=Steinernema glaseri TaxID=37863 RepID=A0A1I8AKN8_9BILA
MTTTTTERPTTTTTVPTTTTTTPTTTTPLPTTTTTVTLPPTTTSTVPTTTADPCSGQSAPCFNGHIYFVNHQRLTWSNSEAYCISLGGHLTSILSAEESAFVAETIAASDDRIQKLGSDIWIGGSLQRSEEWTWTDGSAWNYTNFRPFQPSQVPGNNCLQIFDSGFARWMNYVCSRQFPSVCKIRVSSK